MFIRIFSVFALMALVGVAGCGGDSSSSSNPEGDSKEPPVSSLHGRYDMNAFCDRGDAELTFVEMDQLEQHSSDHTLMIVEYPGQEIETEYFSTEIRALNETNEDGLELFRASTTRYVGTYMDYARDTDQQVTGPVDNVVVPLESLAWPFLPNRLDALSFEHEPAPAVTDILPAVDAPADEPERYSEAELIERLDEGDDLPFAQLLNRDEERSSRVKFYLHVDYNDDGEPLAIHPDCVEQFGNEDPQATMASTTAMHATPMSTMDEQLVSYVETMQVKLEAERVELEDNIMGINTYDGATSDQKSVMKANAINTLTDNFFLTWDSWVSARGYDNEEVPSNEAMDQRLAAATWALGKTAARAGQAAASLPYEPEGNEVDRAELTAMERLIWHFNAAEQHLRNVR